MRTAEARRIVAAQRQHIANLKAIGGRTLEAEQTLSTYESPLRHIEEYEAALRGARKRYAYKKPLN
jgi:hypothetical protein